MKKKLLSVLLMFCVTSNCSAFMDSLLNRQLNWRLEVGYLTPPVIPNNLFDKYAAIIGLSRVQVGIGPSLKINDKWHAKVLLQYNHQFVKQRHFFPGFSSENLDNTIRLGLDEIMISVGLERRLFCTGSSTLYFHTEFQSWYYLNSVATSNEKETQIDSTWYSYRVKAYPTQKLQFSVNLGLAYRFTAKKNSWGLSLDLQLRQNRGIHYYFIADGWLTYDNYYSTSYPYLGFSTFIEI